MKQCETLEELRRENANRQPAVSVPVPQQSTIHEQVSEIINEERDRERRRNNLCVSGLDLSGDNAEDLSTFKSICTSELGLTSGELSDSVTQMKTLSSGSSDGPSLVLISIRSLDVRRKIISNASKLKDYRTASNNRVFIRPDLTRKQQEEDKKLRDDLRRRRNQGENVIIKHGRITQVERGNNQVAPIAHGPTNHVQPDASLSGADGN